MSFPTTRMPAVRSTRRRITTPRWAVLCVVPALAAMLVFEYWPLVRTIFMSMQGTNLFGQPTGFVGFDNYARMFQSSDFWHTISVTALFTVGSVVATLLVGLAVAIPLTTRLRGTGLIRATVMIPMAVSVAAAGLAFRSIYQPETGAADRLLSFVGIDGVGWLTDPAVAIWSVIIVDAWVGLGFTVLLLLAAFDGVPEDVLEAASLDGAGLLRRVRHVALPIISPTLFFLIVTETIGAMREFTAIQVLTQGGPANATHTLVIDIYQAAFGSGTSDYAAASARGIVLLLLIVLVTAVQFRFLDRKVAY
nr:sn-glycerol-3-phosphate transport system permease protein UgpA [Cryobacterium sp. SO1]